MSAESLDDAAHLTGDVLRQVVRKDPASLVQYRCHDGREEIPHQLADHHPLRSLGRHVVHADLGDLDLQRDCLTDDRKHLHVHDDIPHPRGVDLQLPAFGFLLRFLFLLGDLADVIEHLRHVAGADLLFDVDVEVVDLELRHDDRVGPQRPRHNLHRQPLELHKVGRLVAIGVADAHRIEVELPAEQAQADVVDRGVYAQCVAGADLDAPLGDDVDVKKHAHYGQDKQHQEDTKDRQDTLLELPHRELLCGRRRGLGVSQGSVPDISGRDRTHSSSTQYNVCRSRGNAEIGPLETFGRSPAHRRGRQAAPATSSERDADRWLALRRRSA